MQRLCWLAAGLLLQGLSWATAQTVSMACYQTDDQIRNQFASMYDEVIINCLSVTPSGSVDNVILSTFNSSSNATARFILTCDGESLSNTSSNLSANLSLVSTAGCSSSCVDAVQPCTDPCDPLCARCVGSQPSNCTLCASAKLTDGTCATSCPSVNLKPNLNMGMLCQCTSIRYSGGSTEAQEQCERLVELAEEQLQENDAEYEARVRKSEKLAIGLPIACFVVVLFCVIMSVFAQWNYPAQKHYHNCKLPQSDPFSGHAI